jgi:hypothetical protein
MGGTELEMNSDESQNTAEWPKPAIQDEQGLLAFTQQLFLVSMKGDDNAADDDASAGAGAKQEPPKSLVRWGHCTHANNAQPPRAHQNGKRDRGGGVVLLLTAGGTGRLGRHAHVWRQALA